MKWLLIGFIIIQVGVDLAHSVTAFPFVHYGMFSESFERPDSVEVLEVTVDGRRLQAGDFRIYRWDMIQGPLAAIEKQTATRDFAFDKEKLKQVLSRMGMSAAITSRMDNAASVEARFPAWYKDYLSGLLRHPISVLQVDKTWYHYEDGQLKSYRKENWIHL